LKLKVLTWNLRRATSKSEAWMIVRNLLPDIMILQEDASIPQDILTEYSCLSKKARSKGGGDQSISTAILSRMNSLNNYQLHSSFDWVQKEVEYFNGNILAGEIIFESRKPIRIISVYSPAWPIPNNRLTGIDTSSNKLINNKNVFCTELLWASLNEESIGDAADWIVAGDLNSSTTFHFMWAGGPSGNQEIIDRLFALRFSECLFLTMAN